jgi:hypothetical protein
VNRRICTRLSQLERASAAASLVRRSAPCRDGSFTEELRQALRAQGFEQWETEGLMGTFARFLGITTHDLKATFSQSCTVTQINRTENEQHH